MKKMLLITVLSVHISIGHTKILPDYFPSIEKSRLCYLDKLIDSLEFVKRKKIPFRYAFLLCETKNKEYINPYYPKKIFYFPLFKIEMGDFLLLFYDSFDGVNRKTYIASYDIKTSIINKRLLILHKIDGLPRDAHFYIYKSSKEKNKYEIVIKQIYPMGIEDNPRSVEQIFLLDKNFSPVSMEYITEPYDEMEIINPIDTLIKNAS